MSIVNTFSLQSNKQIKINFDGGDLSSDAGLLLMKEFSLAKFLKSEQRTAAPKTILNDIKYCCEAYLFYR